MIPDDLTFSQKILFLLSVLLLPFRMLWNLVTGHKTDL